MTEKQKSLIVFKAANTLADEIEAAGSGAQYLRAAVTNAPTAALARFYDLVHAQK